LPGIFYFVRMPLVCYNGAFLPDDQPVLLVNNRGYKWGDGLFETIKVHKEQLLLKSFHFDRLLTSIKLLQIHQTFTLHELEQNIVALCAKNDCLNLARVRLAVYRDQENNTSYSIEAIPLDQSVMQWNEQGLTIDIYPYSRKACDVLANLKTANYLPYVMASRYAEEQGLQECLVLNAFNHVCDASKANVFVIKDSEVYTPSLEQGCINGVMRRFLLQELKAKGWKVKQGELTEELLLQADECFLTNAIQGIRWVSQYREKQFASHLTKQIFDTILSTNWC
jgi:branched-chain amino acid aminotransferase